MQGKVKEPLWVMELWEKKEEKIKANKKSFLERI